MSELMRPPRIRGTLEAPATLAGHLTVPLILRGTISRIPIHQVEYAGPYIVDPAFNDQILDTDQKYMTEDVTVKAIAVSRTSNLAGGTTVYIGGVFDG